MTIPKANLRSVPLQSEPVKVCMGFWREGLSVQGLGDFRISLVV